MDPIAAVTRHDRLVRALDEVVVGLDQRTRQVRGGVVEHVGRLVGQNLTFTTLLILWRMREEATTRMTELASSVGVTGATITRQIQDLERKGLILRVQDGQDGRASIVRLTEAGRRIAEVSSEARWELLGQAVQDWSDDDLEQMVALFQRLYGDIHRSWNARTSVFLRGGESAGTMPEDVWQGAGPSSPPFDEAVAEIGSQTQDSRLVEDRQST